MFAYLNANTDSSQIFFYQIHLVFSTKYLRNLNKGIFTLGKIQVYFIPPQYKGLTRQQFGNSGILEYLSSGVAKRAQCRAGLSRDPNKSLVIYF